MVLERSLHPCVLELTTGETLSTSEPWMSIPMEEARDHSLKDTMEEKPNENQKHPIMKAIREYSDHIESQTYTKISTPLADNTSTEYYNLGHFS